MSKDRELLPCPFCGSAGNVYNDGEDWISVCSGDDCHHLPCCVGNESHAEAVAKWNRRAHLSTPDADARDGWISVADRLPTHVYSVLGVITEWPFHVPLADPQRDIVSYNPVTNKWFQYEGVAVVQVSYWRDLPELPIDAAMKSDKGEG